MEDKGGNPFIIILVIVVVWLWSSLNTAHQKIDKLQTEYDYCEADNYDLEYEISKKENTIDDLNSEIEDAQSEAWTNYYNMGYTLEDLQTY